VETGSHIFTLKLSTFKWTLSIHRLPLLTFNESCHFFIFVDCTSPVCSVPTSSFLVPWNLPFTVLAVLDIDHLSGAIFPLSVVTHCENGVACTSAQAE